MNPKKMLSCILALLLLCVPLAACANETVPGGDETTKAPAETTAPMTDTTAPAETEYPAPDVENTNYSGQTIRVLANEPYAGRFEYSEIYYSEESGDIINDALFKRNAQITEKYGVTIETTDTSTGKAAATFRNAVNANNNDFHFASLSINTAMAAAQQGLLANIAELPYLDPDAPWYYQNIRENLSIGGEEYLLTGYFNMRIFDTITLVAYNKNMAEKFEIEDLDKLALDGKWTLDKMHELSTLVGNDLNNDGITNGDDQLGVACHSGMILNFFVAAGGAFVEKDANDLPVYIGLSEKNEQLLSRITDFLYDEPASLHGATSVVTFEVHPFDVDRMLFKPTSGYGMVSLSNKGINFGVVPFPKADETQEEYISMTHSGLGTAVIIPHNNTEMEMTCAIVADMMYLSHKIIYPAHIEKAMQLRYSPDENSTKVLQLLFDSLTLEISSALKLGCDTQLRAMGNDHLNNFSSAFQSIKGSDETLLANYIDAFTKKE